MNIFLVDFNLDNNAKFFKDNDPKRFNKQIVESTQLLAASMKHYHGIELIKADGTPYIVNRILHHPACKWLMSDIKNHYWHIRYLQSLLRLSPQHSCGKTLATALSKMLTVNVITDEPMQYLKITNSDMSGIPSDAPVTEFYKRHLQNKWIKDEQKTSS